MVCVDRFMAAPDVGRPADRAEGDRELLRAEQVRRGGRLGDDRARQQHGGPQDERCEERR